MRQDAIILGLQIVGAAWHQAARALQPVAERDEEIHALWRQIDRGLAELERKIRRYPEAPK